MIYLLFIFIFLLPKIVYAAPAVIVIGYILSVAGVGMYAYTIASVIVTVLTVAAIGYSIYSSIAQSNSLKDKLKTPGSKYSANSIDNTWSNEGIVPIVYGGPIVMGGNIIWQSDPGSVVKRFIAFCVGEVSAITNVCIDETAIEALSGCSYTAYYGTSAQTPDSRCASAVSGLKDLAYLALTLTASDKVTSGSISSCDITGRKIKTWNSSTGSWDTNALSSSKNPVAITRDYLLLSTTVGGCGLPESYIDNASFGIASEYCDVLVDGTIGDFGTEFGTDIITMADTTHSYTGTKDGAGVLSIDTHFYTFQGSITPNQAGKPVSCSDSCISQHIFNVPTDITCVRYKMYGDAWYAFEGSASVSVKVEYTNDGTTWHTVAGTADSGTGGFGYMGKQTISDLGEQVLYVNILACKGIRASVACSASDRDGWVSSTAKIFEIQAYGRSNSADEKRYELDLVIDTKHSALDNLANFFVTCNMALIKSGAQYKIMIEKSEETAVMAFTEDNIKKGSFNYGYGRAEDYPNKVGVEWVSALEPRNPKRLSFAEDEIDQETRGVHEEKIQTYGIIRQSQALRLAKKILYERKLNDIWCEFESNMSAMHCEPMDVVSITHSRPGWVVAPFRIKEITESGFGRAKYLCQAYNSSVLNDGYDTAYTNWDSDNSNLYYTENEDSEYKLLTVAEDYKKLAQSFTTIDALDISQVVLKLKAVGQPGSSSSSSSSSSSWSSSSFSSSSSSISSDSSSSNSESSSSGSFSSTFSWSSSSSSSSSSLSSSSSSSSSLSSSSSSSSSNSSSSSSNSSSSNSNSSSSSSSSSSFSLSSSSSSSSSSMSSSSSSSSSRSSSSSSSSSNSTSSSSSSSSNSSSSSSSSSDSSSSSSLSSSSSSESSSSSSQSSSSSSDSINNVWLWATIESDNSNQPSGTILAQSDFVSTGDVSSIFDWVTFSLPTPLSLDAATKYWIVFHGHYTKSDTEYITWKCDASSSSYSFGDLAYLLDRTGLWTVVSNADFMFRIVQ